GAVMWCAFPGAAGCSALLRYAGAGPSAATLAADVMVVSEGAFCCSAVTEQSLDPAAPVLASPPTTPARMRKTLSFFMTHLLALRGEGPLAETAEVDRSLQ